MILQILKAIIKTKRITDAEPVIEAKGLSHKGTIKPFDITINKGVRLLVLPDFWVPDVLNWFVQFMVRIKLIQEL